MQGQGLNERQLALCDAFVYIPQVRRSLLWEQWAGSWVQ